MQESFTMCPLSCVLFLCVQMYRLEINVGCLYLILSISFICLLSFEQELLLNLELTDLPKIADFQEPVIVWFQLGLQVHTIMTRIL